MSYPGVPAVPPLAPQGQQAPGQAMQQFLQTPQGQQLAQTWQAKILGQQTQLPNQTPQQRLGQQIMQQGQNQQVHSPLQGMASGVQQGLGFAMQNPNGMAPWAQRIFGLGSTPQTATNPGMLGPGSVPQGPV